MNLPSRLQKNCLGGRLVSLVSRRALANGSSARLTQMFTVPLWGLRKAMNLPSGEICAPEISELPNISSRSISGGIPFCASAVAPGRNMKDSAQSKNLVAKEVRVFLIISQKAPGRCLYSVPTD